MEKSSVNIPNFGRIRELATGARFVAYALCRNSAQLPRWIRLGKWMSKAAVAAQEITYVEKEGNYVSQHVLNPLDLTDMPSLFDLINMPPVSLIENAHLSGPYYLIEERGQDVCLPADLAYRFP